MFVAEHHGNKTKHFKEEGLELSEEPEETCKSIFLKYSKAMLGAASLTREMLTKMNRDLKSGVFAFTERKCWGHRDDKELLQDKDLLSLCTTSANVDENVTLMKEEQTIKAFQPAKYKDYFLCNDSGKLIVRKVVDFMVDERCHFVKTRSINPTPCCSFVYTFQSRNDHTVYLGVRDEKTFGLIDTNSTSTEWNTKFSFPRCKNSPIHFLKPSKELIVLCDKSSEGEFNFTVVEDEVAADPDLKYDIYEGLGLAETNIDGKSTFKISNLSPFTNCKWTQD